MKDFYGTERKAGEEWLIGVDRTASHVLDVNEEFVKDVHITSLNNR
jgi:hypothetical protein